MRKILATALLAVALGAHVGARAEPMSGHILLGNPTTPLQISGISEAVSGCEPDGPGDGIDGQWFAVVAAKNVAVTVIDGATGAEDLDVYFYDENCEFIEDLSMATENVSETGTAPAGAAYLVVDLVFGADATFEVTIS